MAIQIISTYEILLFAGAVLAVLGGVYALRRQIKSQMDEFVTKDYVQEYVDGKFNLMDQKITTIEKEYADTKKDIKDVKKMVMFLYQEEIKKANK
jgi:hypothetical protein